MKKLFLILIASFLLSSCAFNDGLISNVNNQVTSVELSEKNFTVVDMVRGESSALYIFGIGGLDKNGLVAEAKAKMLANAGLVGTSRAVVNQTVEVKHTFFPFVRKFDVVVTAHIVEFTN